MKNSKNLFLCVVSFFLMTQAAYSSDIKRVGVGFQTTAGVGSPVGFIGLEGNLSLNYFDFCLGAGGGLTGNQYSTMVRYYPGKNNILHFGTGPSFSYHKGTAETKFKDPDTGTVHTDFEVDFEDRYYWWNFEMGLNFFTHPKERKGFLINLTVGAAYLFDTDYNTLSQEFGGFSLAGLMLVPVSSLVLTLQRPIIEKNAVFPYFCASLGYHF